MKVLIKFIIVNVQFIIKVKHIYFYDSKKCIKTLLLGEEKS